MTAEEGPALLLQIPAILLWHALQTGDVIALAFLHTAQAVSGFCGARPDF